MSSVKLARLARQLVSVRRAASPLASCSLFDEQPEEVYSQLMSNSGHSPSKSGLLPNIDCKDKIVCQAYACRKSSKLTTTEDGTFCPKHLTPENRAEKAIPTSHDLQNVHGKALCHAVGCRHWRRLKWAFSGWFCQPHLQQMSHLRCYLEFSKQNSLFDDERRCRMEKASFRKIACPENMQTLLQMDKALQSPLA